MWIVLPTKGCKCNTCEMLRQVVDENGNPLTGADVTATVGFREVKGVKQPDEGAGDADCG